MIKKTITYKDFNGVSRTEDFYFNLKSDEVYELDFSNFEVQKMLRNGDYTGLYLLLKKIILKGYGIKSDDGRKFVKSEDISKDFYETNAYTTLIEELLQKPDEIDTFIMGMIPEETRQKYLEEANKQKQNFPKIS